MARISVTLPARSPTPFQKLAELCQNLEQTTKRGEKTRLIADFLRSVDPSEISDATLFLVGKPFPESDPRVLEVSYATISEASRNLGQTRLSEAPLAIHDVFRTFDKVSEATGAGSRVRKLSLIQTLLTQASPVESEYLVRMMFGEMRIGVVEGIVQDAISLASGAPKELVRRASMLHGDIGDIAKIAITGGPKELQRIGIHLFIPVKPMLAEMAETLETVLREHPDGSAFEYKLDGARIQIHKSGDKVRIYSRRLTDVTDSIGEIVAFAKTKVDASEYLIEGEVVGIGKNGRPIPFQDLMRRFRRVHEIQAMTERIPLKIYLFDALYVDGRTLIDERYSERWEILASLAGEDYLAPRIVEQDKKEISRFFDLAIKEGHEGLMAKSLSSNYSPGARGKKWFKLKRDDKLDIVIVAAEWGSGRRVGWLSNYHLAVLDQETGEYQMIGKTFKGLTDAEFDMITKRLQELKTHEDKWTVYVKPSIVAEVTYNEVQKSPRYKSGFALRFARITSFREDKSPEDADTIQRLRQLYEKQFEKKSRLELT
ncbi:ATP-dependent DNA ligase [Candidatus Bathyarchaeota archaeon]|nr:MAG: ATP-dependent DNA ligase [Candidatus Bathyarchaeota archaeon]